MAAEATQPTQRVRSAARFDEQQLRAGEQRTLSSAVEQSAWSAQERAGVGGASSVKGEPMDTAASAARRAAPRVRELPSESKLNEKERPRAQHECLEGPALGERTRPQSECVCVPPARETRTHGHWV